MIIVCSQSAVPEPLKLIRIFKYIPGRECQIPGRLSGQLKAAQSIDSKQWKFKRILRAGPVNDVVYELII